ncbi:MAG: hypothetical protein O2801_10105 [Actinomycetota bacterium]|nr:hypothetical protein [Actinomycetota bacterium]
MITEPRFAAPFGDAVIASPPTDIGTHLARLKNDAAFYDEMVQRGLALAEKRFSFTTHRQRIDALRR